MGKLCAMKTRQSKNQPICVFHIKIKQLGSITCQSEYIPLFVSHISSLSVVIMQIPEQISLLQQALKK
jgi:hypothetical protein